MIKRDLEIGDIVQLSPKYERFPGFFVIVTELKEFGCMGYLVYHCDFEAVRFKDKAYVRVKFEDMEFCGKSAWIDKRD